jgi:type I restriction-modification system DNA methylase subunit
MIRYEKQLNYSIDTCAWIFDNTLPESSPLLFINKLSPLKFDHVKNKKILQKSQYIIFGYL